MNGPLAALAARWRATDLPVDGIYQTPTPVTQRHVLRPGSIPAAGPRFGRDGWGQTYVEFTAPCPAGHDATWSSTRTDTATAMTFTCPTCTPARPSQAPPNRSAA